MTRLLSLALVLSLSACATQPVRRAGWEPSTGVEALLGLAAAELESLDDLSAEARVTMRGEEGRGTGTAFITYQRPARFRVDIRGPLFTHVLTAVMDGDTLLVQARGQVWRDRAGGDLLGDLLEIELGEYHLPYALLGVVEPGRLDAGAEPRYSRADRAVVYVRDGDRRRRLWVDLFRGFVSREEVYAGGQLAWSRQLRGYRRVGQGQASAYLPREVQIRQGGRSIELVYGRCAVNEGIDPGSFRRGIPATAN